MNKYQELKIEIVYVVLQDIVRTSGESADDFGNWNDNWFSKNSGNN